MRTHAALVLFSSLAASCATAPPPADPIAALRNDAVSRLSCPSEFIRITPVGEETYGPAHWPKYQEVQGCSMHVMYVATDAGYVLNTPRPAPLKGPDHVDVR
jgi:hypothetical protein